MSMTAEDFDLRAAQAAITEAEREHGRLRQEAERVLESKRKPVAEGGKGLSGEATSWPEADFNDVDKAYMAADEANEAVADKRRRYTRMLEIAGGSHNGNGNGRRPHEPVRTLETSRLTPGRRYTESDVYKRMLAAADPNISGSMQQAFRSSPAVELMTAQEAMDSRFRAITGAGNLVIPDRQPDFVDLAQRAPAVVDLVNIRTTGSNTVQYVEKTARTNAAAFTAIGTLLPEHSFTLVLRTATVNRAGTYTYAGEDNLADAGQLRGIIDDELLSDYRLMLDTQMVSGDGTGINFTGILNASGIGTQALGTDIHLDTAHKAITVVRINGFTEPTAFLWHPTDYQTIILSKNAQGDYYFRLGEPPSIWGLPNVVSSVITQGTGLVGNWAGATLWNRSGPAVSASTEHSDLWLRGQVAIKAEGRHAFATRIPVWFCKLTGL